MNSNEKIFLVNKIREIMMNNALDDEVEEKLDELIKTIYSMYD